MHTPSRKRRQQLVHSARLWRRSCDRWLAVTGVCLVMLGCGRTVDTPSGIDAKLRLLVNTEKSAYSLTPVATLTAGPDGVAKQPSAQEVALPGGSNPGWVAGAVFYQIFPERFSNGDRSNDPTRESLEHPENVGDDWAVTPWTSDWYARAGWEKSRGDDFYEHGVFDRRYGGDLQGVLDKLDYLEGLGVNALYLNPVFYARSLHKYDGNTYHHIDPYFGPDPAGDLAMMEGETSDPSTWRWTAADRLFLKLIREAHARGFRIVIDGVFNHTGRGFFAFADLVEKQQASEYADWYVVHQFDDPATEKINEFNYKGWWGVMTLPEFADNEAGDNLHPGPKEYVFNATRRWMDPNGDGDPSDGIDGWRLDVAAEIPSGFWREWNALVREVNPNAYTVAEHWHDASEYLEETGFSAVMNYNGFAFPVKGFLIDGVTSPSDFGAAVTKGLAAMPAGARYAMQNLIDSHDTDRVASMIVNASADRPYLQPSRSDYDVSERVTPRQWRGYDVRKPTGHERRIQRMVAVMQAIYVGAPMMYYGTESGMWGADDPCDRMPMLWPDLTYEAQTADPLGRQRRPDAVAFDSQLHRFYAAAWKMRQQHPVLQRGGFEVVAADDDAQVLAVRRATQGSAMLAVFNRSPETQEIVLPVSAGACLKKVFSACDELSQVQVKPAKGGCCVQLPGLEAVVFCEAPMTDPRSRE